jgi:uncharacterized protein YaaW (UPF0174 family)
LGGVCFFAVLGCASAVSVSGFCVVAGVGAVSTVFVVGGPLAAAVFLVQEGAVAALTAVLFCCPTTVVLGLFL